MHDISEERLFFLGDAFGFTAEDIAQNRQGRMTWAQRGRLWRRFWATALGGVLLAGVPAIAAGWLVHWATGIPLDAAFTDTRATSGYVVALLLGVIYVAANHKTLLLFIDLLLGRVQTVRGMMEIWGRYLVIGGYRFVAEETALESVQAGLRYRAFVLPASNTLLSLEFAE